MDFSNNTIAFLVENNYQTLEFWYPFYRLKEAGAKTVIIGQNGNETYHSSHDYGVTSDIAAKNAKVDELDALIIPGGYAPDKMRVNKDMLTLVVAMYKQKKTVAAICHASWVLVSAGILKGKKATSYHTIKDDLINAGAHYLDEPVVVDDNIITSRQPDDLPDFCRAIIASVFKDKRI